MYFHTFQDFCIPQSEKDCALALQYELWRRVFESKSNRIDFTQIAASFLDADHEEFDDLTFHLNSNSEFFLSVFKMLILAIQGEVIVPHALYPQFCRLTKAYKKTNLQIADGDVTSGGVLGFGLYTRSLIKSPSKSIKPEKTSGFIYFLFDKGNQYMKIGFSSDVSKRIEQHRASNPSLQFVTQVAGTLKEEQHIHDELVTHSIKGIREWYHCSSPNSITNKATQILKAIRAGTVH